MGMVDVARLALLGRQSDVRNDYVDFSLDEFGGQLGEPSVVAIGPLPLDDHVTPLGVARVP